MTAFFVVFFATLAVLFAGLVLTLRQPMRAALALVTHMVCLAAIFACLDVLVAALFQVLIYVGAVMVFMIYTIMLLDDRDASYQNPFSRLAVPAIGVVVLVTLSLLWLLGRNSTADSPGLSAAPFAFVPFSLAFMKHYWFHFELATVLLLVGIIAAWTVIREDR
jgi:NADH-quinone oxidoreductase subunit J